MMKQLVLALALLGTALGANAALYLHAQGEPAPVTGTARIDLGGRPIEIARALIRDPAQSAGGRLDRVDLMVQAADFTPMPRMSAKEPRRPMPDGVSILLSAAGSTPDPAELFQNVYARFLARETWSNPGGLAMRRFRSGTPYEDRELYLGAGGKRVFIALCPLDNHREVEPCTSVLRQDGLDIELRFHARLLPEWRRLTASALALTTEAAEAGAARPGAR